MEITSEELGNIVARFLSTIGENGVLSLTDAINRIGQKFEIDKEQGSYIEISERPSEAGTSAITLSYIVPGLGIPLELRLNPSYSTTRVYFKSKQRLEGYMQFATDEFGNTIHERLYPGVDWDSAISNIGELVN